MAWVVGTIIWLAVGILVVRLVLHLYAEEVNEWATGSLFFAVVLWPLFAALAGLVASLFWLDSHRPLRGIEHLFRKLLGE